jgi:hypothetical protein
MYYPRKQLAGKFTSLYVHPTKKLSSGTGRSVSKGGVGEGGKSAIFAPKNSALPKNDRRYLM